jgi:ATP-dependent Clp protease ATP-binding subunit ClpB
VVINWLAEKILMGDIPDGSRVKVSAGSDRLTFYVTGAKTEADGERVAA